MRVNPVQTAVIFKSGYPTFGNGHLSFKGHWEPHFTGHFEPHMTNSYPGYPGVVPTQTEEPKGRLNILA